jgi:hypothetical protein
LPHLVQYLHILCAKRIAYEFVHLLFVTFTILVFELLDQIYLSNNLKCSVADPGCVSRIPDPKTATKERGKNLLSYLFFCSQKFNKFENYFIFEMLKKKIWAQGSPDPDSQHCSNG